MHNRIIIFLLSISMLVTGCGVKPTKNIKEKPTESVEQKEEKVVLNDRQKQILKEEGLPQDYEELQIKQQIAILNIENMLEYIEEKYNKEFVYSTYYSDALYMESPYMEVYAADDEEKRLITIEVAGHTEDKKVIYKDDYREIMATEEYQEAIAQLIKDCGVDTEVRVYSLIDDLSDGEGDILPRVQSSNYVCMVNPFSSKEEAAAMAKKVLLELEKRNAKGIAIYYYIQTEDQYNRSNYGTYSNFIRRNVSYEYRITSYDNYNTVEIEED